MTQLYMESEGQRDKNSGLLAPTTERVSALFLCPGVRDSQRRGRRRGPLAWMEGRKEGFSGLATSCGWLL